MVVYDFDVERAAVVPAKADAPLIVDADTILTLPVARKLFKPVARRGQEVTQVFCVMEIE